MYYALSRRGLWTIGIALILWMVVELAGCSAGPTGSAGGTTSDRELPAPETAFTISGRTFVMDLGQTGVFQLAADGTASKTGAAIQLFTETPADAPDECMLAVAADDVSLSPPGGSGSVGIDVYIASSGASNPCTEGTNVGAFSLVQEATGLGVEVGQLTLRGAAAALVASGRFTICLEARGDMAATLELAEISVTFGSGGGAEPEEPEEDEPPAVEPVDVSMSVNVDPDDPTIATLIVDDTGELVLLYGEKDEAGNPTRITQLDYWDADMDLGQPGHTMLVDEEGWPTAIYASTGEAVTFTYEGDQVTVHAFDEDGVEITETATLPAGSRAAAKVMACGADPWDKATGTLAEQTAEGTASPILTITGDITLVIKNAAGATIRSWADADVAAIWVADNTTRRVRATPTGDGGYEVVLKHRVKDLQATVAECRSQFESIKQLITLLKAGSGGAGVAVALLGGPAAPAGAVAALLHLLDYWVTDDARACQAVIYGREQQRTSETVVQIVVDNVPGIGGSVTVGEVRYNLYDQSNDIVRVRHFELNGSISDCYFTVQDLSQAEAQLALSPNDPSQICAVATLRKKLQDECRTEGRVGLYLQRREAADPTGWSNLDQVIREYCNSITGCWRVVFSYAGGGSVTHILEVDQGSNLQRQWKVESGGVVAEAVRFPPLANAGLFGQHIRDASQSITRLDDTHYTIAFGYDLWGEFTINDVVEWRYGGDFNYRLPNQTVRFGVQPADQFSGNFSITGENVTYTSDGTLQPGSSLALSGTVTGQRVDCPAPSSPSVYSQEEVLQLQGGQ